ncbi:MAG TPA: penicillin-binding transpeptidase domain-containing protein [Pyrinomonadaceae bacterium]|nr:penicillin-binding transpeptidase domain-containing protein [Pyrinomonadaceae bacterium]
MNPILSRCRPVSIVATFIGLVCVPQALGKTVETKNSKTKAQITSSKASRETTAKASTADLKKKSKRQKEELRRAEQLRKAEAARAAAVTKQRDDDESLREDVESMIAKDDLSGEDPAVRQVALKALGNHAGTVVVMDPKTGRVYSIVNQQWAVREGFKPCSTIKLVTGLAGLSEQVIDPDDTTTISDSNNVSLTNALAYSKNGYFQQVGGQVGFEKMLSYARQLGLGEKTGINMRNEFTGRIPGAGDRSGIARMSSHGDNFEVTPLQLATLVSAIGNGGKLISPFVVRSRQDETKFRTKVRRQIPIDSEAWRTMIPGMVGAVNYGSGRKAHDPAQTVAGKTGTCIENGRWVGLFTSYAPLAHPTLSVVVITRGTDARGHLPAAIAGRIYRDLNGRFGTVANPQIASTRKSFSSTPIDISDDDRNEMGNRTRLSGARNGAVNSEVKPVLMQIPARTPRVEPQDLITAPPVNLDGQTRPRRVSSM